MKDETNKLDPALKQAILLQINQRLFENGTISKRTYEAAKIRIVNSHS